MILNKEGVLAALLCFFRMRNADDSRAKSEGGLCLRGFEWVGSVMFGSDWGMRGGDFRGCGDGGGRKRGMLLECTVGGWREMRLLGGV